jgi:hypothetical protein
MGELTEVAIAVASGASTAITLLQGPEALAKVCRILRRSPSAVARVWIRRRRGIVEVDITGIDDDQTVLKVVEAAMGDSDTTSPA